MSGSEQNGMDTSVRQAGVGAWLKTAATSAIVRRALGYAVGVGAVLIPIDHGDATVAGRVDAARVLKTALTVAVPHCVSTASSVSATLSRPPCGDESRPVSGDTVE